VQKDYFDDTLFLHIVSWQPFYKKNDDPEPPERESGTSFENHCFKALCLDLLHTRHFRAQYCDKKIKRHCNNLSQDSMPTKVSF